MTKKQAIMTSMLIALMLILVFSQKLFDNSFKEVALLDNNLGELQEYSIEKGNLTFSLPDKWIMNEKESDEYTIYQAEFKDNRNINGYIEVISTEDDVKALAQKDINNLALSHNEEKIENYKDKNWRGIVVNYKTKVSTGKSFVNNIYYVGLGDGKVGRFSFIIKENSYKDNMKAIFDTIVSTVSSRGK
ncbi:hypothetical protein ACQPU1_15990 [Clostridium paraputrificum]|uniref:hypothetical protein n=1 Tax=Clostridium paraputrificum TaxID=29363 RepID=UPI003D3566D5